MPTDRRVHEIIIAALYLSFIALRLWRLTDSCLWFDEIFSVHAASHDFGPLIWFVAEDLIHPPLFYLLLKVWIGIGGESLMWLRLFPVFFSALSVAPFLYLCRELRLKSPTTIAALVLFAANGALIKYSQEVRMYAPLLFFSLVSLWLFARFYFRGKNIWILTLVNVLLIYTHYFGWFVIAAEILAIFIFQRVKIRHVLIMAGINIAGFLPWLIAVFRAASAGSDVSQNIGWIARPGVRTITTLIFDLVEPFYFQQSSAEASTIIWISLPLLLLIAVASVLYFLSGRDDQDRQRVYLLTVFVVVPVALALLISWVSPYSIWGSRHLIFIFAPVSILFAIFLTGIDVKAMRFGAFALVGVLIVAALARNIAYTPPNQIWCAWEGLAADLTPDAPTVYTFEDLTAYHVWFAAGRRGEIDVVKVNGVEGIIEDTAYFIPRGFGGIRKTDANGVTGDRFWLMYRDQKFDERHPPLVQLLANGYKIAQKREIRTDTGNGYLVELRK